MVIVINGGNGGTRISLTDRARYAKKRPLLSSKIFNRSVNQNACAAILFTEFSRLT